MNTEKYDLLKDELKVVHFETDRLFIRNYIDADENGFLTIFQYEKSMTMDGDKVIAAKSDEFYRRVDMIKKQDLIFLCI